MGGGIYMLLYILIALLVIAIFKDPLISFWKRQTGAFEREQDLQRKAASTKHGHFYLTIQKYDDETPPVEEGVDAGGNPVWRFDGNEFSNEEAAEFARYSAILAKARGYYTDIDTWQHTLPGPGQFRGRR